jgi:predicted site-specific integrase-resolvase
MERKLLTRKEVAAFLSVSIRTLHNWEREGRLKPLCRLNRGIRYDMADVEKLLTTKPKAHE